MAEYAAAWLERITTEVAPATRASYQERLDHHVLPTLGRLPVPAIGRAQIRALLTTKRQAGYAPNGVRLMKAALSALLSDAADDGLIPANPVLGLSRRRGRRGERHSQVRAMRREQRDAVLETAWRVAPAYAPLLELLAKAGLRPSEAFALRAHDVLLAAGGAVRIGRKVYGGIEGPTKTYERRTVDLTRGLHDLFRRRLKGAPADALVFPNGAAGYLDKSRVGKTFRAVVHAAAHGGDAQEVARCRDRAACRRAWPFRLYDLRHTYASLELARGVPITRVSQQLGHASPVTTFRYYAHWIPTKGRRWVERDRIRSRGSAVVLTGRKRKAASA